MTSHCQSAPTVKRVNRLFCVGLRGLNNPDIVATDVDPRHRDPHTPTTTLGSVLCSLWKQHGRTAATLMETTGPPRC
ncbi:unnamed protein product [Boreogadus saida]